MPTRFDINDLLNSSEFDDLLTEIEKSIENDPDDKSGICFFDLLLVYVLIFHLSLHL